MSVFKVGDRVAVYIHTSRDVGVVTETDQGSNPPGLVSVRTDECGHIAAHEKQCRKLVKKPRKRIWINEYSDTSYSYLQAVYTSLAEAATAGKAAHAAYVCTHEFVGVKRRG